MYILCDDISSELSNTNQLLSTISLKSMKTSNLIFNPSLISVTLDISEFQRKHIFPAQNTGQMALHREFLEYHIMLSYIMKSCQAKQMST